MRNLKAILISEGLIKRIPPRKAFGSGSLDLATFRTLCSDLMAGYGPEYILYSKLIAKGGTEGLLRESHARIIRMLRSDGWDGDLSYLTEFGGDLNDLTVDIIKDNSGDSRRPLDAFDRRPTEMLEAVPYPTTKNTMTVLRRVLSRM